VTTTTRATTIDWVAQTREGGCVCSGSNWTLAAVFSPSMRFVAVAGLNQQINVGDWRYQVVRPTGFLRASSALVVDHQAGRAFEYCLIGHGDEHMGAVTSLAYIGGDDCILASGCTDRCLCWRRRAYLQLRNALVPVAVQLRSSVGLEFAQVYLPLLRAGTSHGNSVCHTASRPGRRASQEDEVQCIESHKHDPSILVSGGADMVARVHDIRQPASCVAVLRGAESDVESVKFFDAYSTVAQYGDTSQRPRRRRQHLVSCSRQWQRRVAMGSVAYTTCASRADL
jgi:WD40 repeat protein